MPNDGPVVMANRLEEQAGADAEAVLMGSAFVRAVRVSGGLVRFRQLHFRSAIVVVVFLMMLLRLVVLIGGKR